MRRQRGRGLTDAEVIAELRLPESPPLRPQVLFAAWLDAASVMQWLRPGATTHTDATIDARVGARRGGEGCC